MQNDSPSSLAKDAWFEPEMFHPLPHDRIVAEADRFEQVQGSLEEKWEVESEKYETIMTISWNGESLDVPRRNYLNEKGTVQDCSIFPYHTSLYPLMDAYDCIYDEEDDDDRNTTAVVRIDHNGGEIVPLHPIASNAVRHSPAVTLSQRRSTIHGAVPQQVPGFMPCTENSILKTLLREIDPMNHAGDSTDFWSVLYAESERHCQAVHSNLGATIAQLSTGQDQLDGFFEYINRNQVFLDSGKQPKVVDPSPYDVLEQLPRVREERIPILLSLLRHALSDLQKDYKLAAAALVLMNQYGDLNDTTMFRQILVILAAEFVCCYRPCSVLDDEEDSAPDHYCSEWHHFHYKIWNAVFCFNLVRITEAHAICIVGFIRSIFTKQFGAVSMTVNNSNSSCHSSESVENKRKHLLKREVATRRAEEEEKEEARGDIAGDIPVQFVERLIFMLGERATQDRKLLSKDTDNLAFAYRKESFLNCLRALTSIAELSAHFLPDYERFTNLTSTIVLSLCRCLVKEDFYNMDLAHDTNYLGQLQFFRGRSLMSPLRYCNRITDPIRRQKIPHDEFKPPIAILDAVRGLFVKNLVDVEHAGLAYGDFVLWCGYDVLPLDPFLFWYVSLL